MYQVRTRLKQPGPRGSLPIGGHRQSRLAGMEPTLRAWLKDAGDLTLAERCARLAAHGIAIKGPALWDQLDKWKLTLKKTLHASEQERADVHVARREWQASHPALDMTKLVFLDETGASTNRARRDGRAAHAASPPCRTDMGTRPPLSPDCVMMTSPPRWWRMAP